MNKFFGFVILSCLTSFGIASAQPKLREQIEGLTSQHSAEDVQYGVVVQDLKSGDVIFQKNAHIPLNPASNTKLLTTFSALSLLGPEFRFKTELLGLESKNKETLKTLTLKGYGDPFFSTERLAGMVRQLKARGIRSVEEVRLDATFFDGDGFPGRMEGRQRDAAFNCTVSALSIDHNRLEVVVVPGRRIGEPAEVSLNPPLPGFLLEAEVQSGKKRGRVIVKNAESESEKPEISVRGLVAAGGGAETFPISVHQPQALVGQRLLAALQTEGIQVSTAARFGAAPDKSSVLAETLSPPLGEILQEINKQSDNFMAEQLTKYLGARFGKNPGSTSAGVRVILKQLKELGVKLSGVMLENGSGLSKKNRIPAETLVQVLQKAYQDPKLRSDFLSSLSILGVDGTLRRKFKNSDAAGRFFGKTGTLNGVSALSGYAFPSADSEAGPYAYAFILNGGGKNFWKEKQLQQDILSLLLK